MSTTEAPSALREETTIVGASVPRADMLAKATGMTDFADNMRRPGMLHVAVARSARAHARILGVDTSRAEAMDGVVAVFTGADLFAELGERLLTGPAFQDQPILAHERVRYVGEPFAAVVATTQALAREAAETITADYDDLQPILDVDEAVAGPPYVHDELRPSKVFSDLGHLSGVRDTNVCYEFNLKLGDPTPALTDAAHVVEGEYWNPPVHHVPLELPCTLGWVEGERLEILSTTQTPSYVRQTLADVLDLPLNRVRVSVAQLGASFGSKMYDRLEPLIAVLAWQLRKPLKMVATREEAFVMTTRHGVATTCRMAADADGNLTAADVEVRYETGAYADVGPRITAKSGLVAAGPYKVPAVRIRSRCVYTNKPSAGPYRGFGVPQVVWPHELTIDELARACGEDPYHFRRRHLLQEGDIAPVGTAMHSADALGCLDAVAEEIDWERPLAPDARSARYLRGRGVAVGTKAVLTPTTSNATIQLNQDASATVIINTVEMGQGSDTIMAQIAAEVLTLPIERVRVVRPDTDVAGYDTITAGSRSTYHMGNAVRRAAEDVRQQLLELGSAQLERPVDQLELHEGAVRGGGAGPKPISAVVLGMFGSRGTTLTGHGTEQTRWIPYDHDTGRSEQVTEHWFAGAVGVELTVDALTGYVKIDHLAVAGDVGRAINPRLVKQQLVGAALLGIGHALFDEMVFDEHGRLVNDSLLDYQIVGARDVPARLTPIVIESPHRTGPFGAKGVGETGILATCPAISNALRDATGVRYRSLPMKPETVLAGLTELTTA